MNNDNKNPLIPYWIKMVTIFFLGWVAIYAGRTVLNPIMPMIQTEFGLSKTELGMISSLFFLAYTTLQIPAGILGDKIGRKKSWCRASSCLLFLLPRSVFHRRLFCLSFCGC